MKKLLFFVLISTSSSLFSQITIVDTLAIQDFETVPATPTWNYTGVLSDLQSGLASPTACIPNTPLGINASQAWHVAQVSAGNPITFDNIIIPPSYDSVRVNFKLAGLNLNGATGGPDHLDYVLVEYSLDNGVSFVGRLRVRGSSANNSFWAYDATGIAAVQHLPATEAMFQASTIGLQTTNGYSFCEISFPGNITQLMVRITPRSSSTSDSWLVDNLVLSGEYNSCTPSSNSITEVVCDSYSSPSGIIHTSSAIFNDTIPNASGCDSIITVDLTVNSSTTSSFSATGLDSYTAPSGTVYTTAGTYEDTIPNAAGCDSIITIDLTMDYTGLFDLDFNSVSVYPNPSSNGIFTINYKGTLHAIRIIDLMGRIIDLPLNLLNGEIDGSELDSGKYFIQITTDKGRITKEIVIHRTH